MLRARAIAHAMIRDSLLDISFQKVVDYINFHCAEDAAYMAPELIEEYASHVRSILLDAAKSVDLEGVA